MNTTWFLILNPISGNGKSKKYWNKISTLLTTNGIQFSFAFTAYSKHEVQLVQQAIKNGFTKIISVGGDGTLHHIVNGIMTQNNVKTSTIQLAVIPIGTGNDWVKTYNIPTNIEKSILTIKKGTTILQDIGCLRTKNMRHVYFHNVAGIGYDGYVVYHLNALKKFGKIAYLLSGLYGLLCYKKSTLTLKFNDQVLKEKCLMTIFGICKFSGGGMQFTKDVDPTDGLLDITVAKNFNLLDLLLNLRKLYTGAIVSHKKVSTYKTNQISITANTEKEKNYIQADGELIGSGLVKVTLVRRAIQFVIPNC